MLDPRELRIVPENARRCRICGWMIVPTKHDPDRDLCFCCARNIPIHFTPEVPPDKSV